MSQEVRLADLVVASRNVEPEVPQHLLSYLASVPTTLNVLSSYDQLHRAIVRAEDDFPGIQTLSSDHRAAPSNVRQLGLLRWLVDGLSAWTPAEDPRHVQLVALLVMVLALGKTRSVWKALPDTIGVNTGLLAALEAAVLSSHVTLSPGSGATIWETEAVAAMARADKERDWEKLVERWLSFETIMNVEPFLSVAAQGLARFKFDRLVPATRNHAAMVDCMRLARALTIDERLRLAAMTTNEHVRFGCTYAASLDTPRNASLSAAAQRVLTDVLVAVSQDLSNWHNWLAVFARHSVRHGSVQAPLGEALALVAVPAVEAYVESVELQVGGSVSRDAVTACMRAFRDRADATRRAMMWKLTFDRWSSWNFRGDIEGGLASGLSRSDLDFAVVGHAVCALSADDRSQALVALRTELGALDEVWHRSHVDLLSSWFGLLSKMQVFAHAEHVVAEGTDWLATTMVHLPYEPANAYIRLRFGSFDRYVR